MASCPARSRKAASPLRRCVRCATTGWSTGRGPRQEWCGPSSDHPTRRPTARPIRRDRCDEDITSVGAGWHHTDRAIRPVPAAPPGARVGAARTGAGVRPDPGVARPGPAGAVTAGFKPRGRRRRRDIGLLRAARAGAAVAGVPRPHRHRRARLRLAGGHHGHGVGDPRRLPPGPLVPGRTRTHRAAARPHPPAAGAHHPHPGVPVAARRGRGDPRVRRGGPVVDTGGRVHDRLRGPGRLRRRVPARRLRAASRRGGRLVHRAGAAGPVPRRHDAAPGGVGPGQRGSP